MSETTHRALRLALTSLLGVALVAQLVIGMSRADLTVTDLLSLFTFLSNMMAAVMLATLALRPSRTSTQGFALFRGAVTVYMSATALVYAVFLATTGVAVGITEPWVDWSLHVVGPVAIALDWILYPPELELPQGALPMWLAFPAAYLVYSLIRGALVDWYPYPFLDPTETGGYAGVAMWSPVVLAVILGFSHGFLWWANRHSPTPQPA